MKDKILFTPGPLTTSKSVKEAMLHDFGSRDYYFIETVKFVREQLLKIACVSKVMGYETIIMQGSGTFGIESVLSSVIDKDGHLLNIINGAYGLRIGKISSIHNINTKTLLFEENKLPDLEQIEQTLFLNPEITHVSVVDCETTTGIINPVYEIGQLCKKYDKTYIVDAMSSFGAVEIDSSLMNIDFLISSSNKCIEGVPGFSFVIADKIKLLETEGHSRSLVLDLFAQWKGLESDGQFRFTPPTHAIMAFKQALTELEAEGGVIGRSKRYKENYETLIQGMEKLGFKEYLPREMQGYIITSFYYPENTNFEFNDFYNRLNNLGMVIYPGKLSKANCFRIGNIGRIFKQDIIELLNCIKKVKSDMGF